MDGVCRSTKAHECVRTEVWVHVCVRTGKGVCMGARASTRPSLTHLCFPSGNLA